jgi:hypothetical protein
MKTVNRSESGFSPSGNAAPGGYRLVYRLLGFRRAEKIADYKRGLRKKLMPRVRAEG